MKGLTHIPQKEDLSQAYAAIQSARAILENDYARWSQWTRFDPRLAEQLIASLNREWRRLSPVLLNQELLQHPWPATFGVLLEMIRLLPGWNKTSVHTFLLWSKCVMNEIQPSHHELFFIGTRGFAGNLLRKDAEQSIKTYAKWGFIGRDLLLGKNTQTSTTLLTKNARKNMIDELLAEKKHFTVTDYINKSGHSLNRRQAQRDLKGDHRLKHSGSTHARFYRAS
jgi:hypothetical protein